MYDLQYIYYITFCVYNEDYIEIMTHVLWKTGINKEIIENRK